jgi:hypothetical protein
MYLIRSELQIITALAASGMTVEIISNKLCTGTHFCSPTIQSILTSLANQNAQ